MNCSCTLCLLELKASGPVDISECPEYLGLQDLDEVVQPLVFLQGRPSLLIARDDTQGFESQQLEKEH